MVKVYNYYVQVYGKIQVYKCISKMKGLDETI